MHIDRKILKKKQQWPPGPNLWLVRFWELVPSLFGFDYSSQYELWDSKFLDGYTHIMSYKDHVYSFSFFAFFPISTFPLILWDIDSRQI